MTQQNTMPELKPCPMCGGKATLSKWESPIGVHEEVRCFKCGTSNPIIKFWNTRTPDHLDLLKHARYYLDGVARDAYDNRLVCEIIHNIDKVLGEQNVT